MIILHGEEVPDYLGNSNLYHVIYGRPLHYDILGQKSIYVLMVLNAFLKYWPKIILFSLSLDWRLLFGRRVASIGFVLIAH